MIRLCAICFVSILLCSFLMETQESRFDEVVLRFDEDKVKDRLVEFANQGIERPLSVEYEADSLIKAAMSYLGTPHCMGGRSRSGIDCSGLVMNSFAEVNIRLPHSAHEQARFGQLVPQSSELEKGDIVFFFNSYATKNLITHSGIYIGDGEFVHTSSSKGVVVTKIDDPYYWGERFLFGTRIH